MGYFLESTEFSDEKKNQNYVQNTTIKNEY